MLNGKKTYIAGVALMLVAVAGFVLNFVQPEAAQAMPFDAAFALFLNGLGFFGVRHAIAKTK